MGQKSLVNAIGFSPKIAMKNWDKKPTSGQPQKSPAFCSAHIMLSLYRCSEPITDQFCAVHGIFHRWNFVGNLLFIGLGRRVQPQRPTPPKEGLSDVHVPVPVT